MLPSDDTNADRDNKSSPDDKSLRMIHHDFTYNRSSICFNWFGNCERWQTKISFNVDSKKSWLLEIFLIWFEFHTSLLFIYLRVIIFLGLNTTTLDHGKRENVQSNKFPRRNNRDEAKCTYLSSTIVAARLGVVIFLFSFQQCTNFLREMQMQATHIIIRLRILRDLELQLHIRRKVFFPFWLGFQ